MTGDSFKTSDTLNVSQKYVTEKYWTEKIMGEIFYDAGGLWAWGQNSSGQLGLGDITHRSSPVQVGSLTNWKATSAGYYHITAIKTDGTLWTCGYNTYGQLGLGDRTHRSSPVQVGSLTTWKSVSAAVSHTLAIK